MYTPADKALLREPNDPGGDADQYTDEQFADDLRSLHSECWEYEGSIIEDCASIVDLGYKLQALRNEPPAENLFDKSRRLNQQKADAHNLRGRENAQGGYYGV